MRRSMGPRSGLVGKIFGGRFRVTEFLSEGGMGSVHKAIDTQDDTKVAIKVMSEELTKSEVFVKRFVREAKTAASLRHRSTVRIIDFGVEDERVPYIVMELVQGAELIQILRHEGRLTEARTARILAQVASALAEAHDLGIVHRDLKPENIMVMRDPNDPDVERVKVLDFGIAKIMTPEMVAEDSLPVSSERMFSSRVPELTMMGTLVGTPEYMAPEQLRGEAVDARTDVYACGLLMHQLLTGVLPLSGETFVQISIARNEETAPRVSDRVPATHERLDELVSKTLELDRTARPASARQLQEQIQTLLPELANVLLPLAKSPPTPKTALPKVSTAAASASTEPSISMVPLTESSPSTPRTPVSPAVETPGSSPRKVKIQLEQEWEATPVTRDKAPIVRIIPELAVRDPTPITGSEITLASPTDEAVAPSGRKRPRRPDRTLASQLVLIVGVMILAAALTAWFMRG
jgi:serine/threonine protein kinase